MPARAPHLEPAEARRLLGVGPDADRRAIRAAYRRALRSTHPDLSAHPEATERTARLTAAYHVLSALEPPPTAPPPPPAQAPPPPADAEQVSVWLVDDVTIGIDAPAEEVLHLLVDAADQIGDIAYLDRSAGLLEVVVEFVSAPTSSVVLTMQGRATGVTEVFCSVEPLSGGDAPPSDAVTLLLLEVLGGRTGDP